MFAEDALNEIEQWRKTKSSHYQLDWRWVERYRALDAYDAYWWWAQAGPFNEEEQEQWNRLVTRTLDDETKEHLGKLISQSLEREVMIAIAEQREPRFYYPALDIEQVHEHIIGLLQLDEEISHQEPNAIVRRLYHGAIEDELSFLRLIEATYEGNSERFKEINDTLFGVPTSEEMQYALFRVKETLLLGRMKTETMEISQRLSLFLRKSLCLSPDLTSNEEAFILQQNNLRPSPDSQRMISPQATRKFFEEVLHECGYDQWQIIIDPKSSGPRVESGLRQLFLPDNSIPIKDISHYLAHELAGHVARSVAGERSPLGLLGINTKGYSPTEEGLALYLERRTAELHGQAFDDSGSWLGILATGLASGVMTTPQTFLSLFTFFEAFFSLRRLLKGLDRDIQKAHEKARKTALARCLRTYRGVPDLEKASVCLCKDVVYLRGLWKVERAVAEDKMLLDRLAVGKVALELLPDLQELDIVAPPQPLRKLADDPDLETRILSFEQREQTSS
jgi:hypothetical protein